MGMNGLDEMYGLWASPKCPHSLEPSRPHVLLQTHLHISLQILYN